MPPKKKSGASNQKEASGHKDSATKQEKDPEQQNTLSKKRKANTESEQPVKASRRSARGTPKPKPSHSQLLNYLLSHDAEAQCRPPDETEDIESRGKDIKTYSSSVLNPFEELTCAMILSRPISHRLGLRSIRTILNSPYSFNSALAIKNAGEEKVTQAFYDARTQHKDKTAAQLYELANTVLEKFTAAEGDEQGTQLGRVLKEHKGDVDEAVEELKKEIKGFGATGIEIFLRRVQWLEGWDARYPYVDSKTQKALEELGLPSDANDLRDAVEQEWKTLNTKHLAGEDEAGRKRRAFVVILERASTTLLESKVDDVSAAAAAFASET
ncbi:hypothetical protein CB0940_02143 [Cercospora beticola]|uniref:Uncharacterized protein n=1 Tax=Cercospora beticola TaxID=122368 RepID=A0A2G5I8T8_CERBT|nr:hypothetical protein CB0940_02143 [Cercospora beticola]PIB00883.1 hypothetical protein CB0940_02143 [Cercospora beticola]WPA97723.1 hypothetical protein RHO25_002334 [Cercospora beticola]